MRDLQLFLVATLLSGAYGLCCYRCWQDPEAADPDLPWDANCGNHGLPGYSNDVFLECNDDWMTCVMYEYYGGHIRRDGKAEFFSNGDCILQGSHQECYCSSDRCNDDFCSNLCN